MICFFGGRADLWPPRQNTVDRLLPRPPELLAILSRTFSDPGEPQGRDIDRGRVA
jgi:hypothetical protein